MLQPPAAAVLPQPNPDTRLRFGWSWAGHAVIEKAGAELLPDSPYKQFLQQSMSAINANSVDEDRRRMGPGHFINLEILPRSKRPPHPDLKRRREFDTVSKAFYPSIRRMQQDEFRKAPLSKQDLSGGENVFNRAMRHYRQLVSLLSDLGQNPPATEVRQQEAAEALQSTIGALAHYIGDMHQPLHATSHHTWSLMHAGRGGSHAHLERNVMSGADYQRWKKAIAAQPPSSLSDKQIEQRLLRAIEASFMGVFDLVDAERAVRKRKPDAGRYFAQLNAAWKPTVESRMEDSARMLADVLHSAYVAAGKPDLAPLHNVSMRGLGSMTNLQSLLDAERDKPEFETACLDILA